MSAKGIERQAAAGGPLLPQLWAEQQATPKLVPAGSTQPRKAAGEASKSKASCLGRYRALHKGAEVRFLHSCPALIWAMAGPLSFPSPGSA